MLDVSGNVYMLYLDVQYILKGLGPCIKTTKSHVAMLVLCQS